MKPLFFPFTYLKEKDAEILLTFFNSFSFLSTSSEKEFKTEAPKLYNNTSIEPVFMEEDEIMPVIETVKEYKKWALLNKGNLDALKTLFRKTPYFTSDTGVANIRSEIGRRIQESSASENKPNFGKDQNFLNALLFLRLAHENDAEKDAIDREFQTVTKEERQVFLDVRGELKENFSDKVLIKQNSDPGILMTDKRLCAWANVLIEKIKHFNFKESLVLVTTSRGVAEYFDSAIEDDENTSGIEKLLLIENYKIFRGNSNLKTVCRKHLTAIINNAISGNRFSQKDISGADDGEFLSVDISLYRFFGAGFKNLFCSRDTQNIKNESLKNFGKDIFICFIETKAAKPQF